MKSIEISGFGGTYEFGCQLMLKNGIEYLKDHPTLDLSEAFKTYKDVYGLVFTETKEGRDFEQYILKDTQDATGAMFHGVVKHLIYISKHGYEAWIANFPQDRVFEFDGTIESCPIERT